jgi:hypothetical protein
VAELGKEAEEAGWDGVFVWDGIDGNDPWVTLAAVATLTSKVKLGTIVTPLSRRRPWKLAQETATLDRLSNGRLILSVGLGAIETGFAKYGEEIDRKKRAALLDEGLEVLAGLWSGKPFTHEGQYYTIDNVDYYPRPVQQPRIPVWVVGAWPKPKSMERTLRWDGILPIVMHVDGSMAVPNSDELRAMKAYIDEHREGEGTFDIVTEGETPGDGPDEAAAIIRPLAEAGLTWWLENVWDTPRSTAGLEGMRRRVRQGPPRF